MCASRQTGYRTYERNRGGLAYAGRFTGGGTKALSGLGTLCRATRATIVPKVGPTEIQRGANRVTADTSVPSTALLTGADRGGSNYTARHLLVLEGLRAVRKRPGMDIGSAANRGLIHCLWETIDNAVDEALGGYCDRIEVHLHDDGSVEVRDNGRGIPVDVEPKTGLSGVEVVMTKLHAGGKFGGGSYAASGGLHGVGASVVNALSARLDVEVDRDGKTHAMSFRRGAPGTFGNGTADSPFDPSGGLLKGKRVPKTRTGTRVRYWSDRQIFLKDAKLSLENLHQRARQTAFLRSEEHTSE